MLFTPPPPRFSSAMLSSPYEIINFIEEILAGYPLQIDLPFAVLIFEEGIRPQHPVFHENRQQTLSEWFIDQVAADISMLHPATPERFEDLLDQIDRQISRSLLEYGTIAAKYDLYPSQYGVEGVKQIHNYRDVQVFKKHFLTEAVLNSELEILTLIYYQLWGILYAIKT